jgi:hypothetical protein
MTRFPILGFGSRYIPILLLVLLANTVGPSVAVGEHKNILYHKTVGRYAVESKKKIKKKYIRTGRCIQRETDMDGAIQLCENLNSTYSGNHDDAWVVVSEDGRVIDI